MKLAGHVALVTGAGKGLGAAIARVLAHEGASLALCGRRIGPLEELAAELGPNHFALVCDVCDEAQIQNAVAQTVSRFGKLDVLVNNAGIADWVPFDRTTTEYFDEVISTNLRGPFLCSRHAWPHLKATKGQILNVSSIAGSQPFEDMAAYCSSKFALNGLSGVLSLEGLAHGIRVLNLSPGSVNTDIWGSLADEGQKGRMMTSEQVADLARWLLTSPRNVQVRHTLIENFKSPFDE